MWTEFWDMHSGGTTKENFEKCYIEAPEDEAIDIFISIFGHHPESVACECCGENYSISESETLAEATAYHRGCAFTLAEFCKKPEVRVIDKFTRFN